MPISVVVGGQFGSEGKGKAALFLAKKYKAKIAVRIGGPNSGHTVYVNNKKNILYQIPTAAFIKDMVCVIGPGSYININSLLLDINATNLQMDRLLIDEKALILNNSDVAFERNNFNEIVSTFSGVGAALIRKIGRKQTQTIFAKDILHKNLVCNTSDYLYNELKNGEHVILEGTQGFGLSLIHSPYYPYVTARDTTAASFLCEAGLSPKDVTEILLVIRAFPIRVGGHSGPLENEITWEKVSTISGYKDLTEYTSVTNRLRRVGYFDASIVNLAIKVNNPTNILLNHVDYFDCKCSENKHLTNKAIAEINKIKQKLIKDIDYVGISPDIILKHDY